MADGNIAVIVNLEGLPQPENLEVKELEEQLADARSEARKALARALEIRRAADERLTIISRLIRALEVVHPVPDDSIRALLHEARECIATDPQ